jgi:hypothetical protein
MSPAQRKATKKDHPSGKMKKTQRTVSDLRKDLQAIGVLGMGNKKKLQQLAVHNHIPIEISTLGIVEGWEGKAKGIMLQILFEWGHIDSSKKAEYTVDGKNDDFGNLDAETSLRHVTERTALRLPR